MDATIKLLQQDTIPTLDLDDIRKRNAATRQLLQEWLADESGYDEETWPLLKEALEANRTSPHRKLFRD
jgi:hypothetical protein